MTPDKSKKIQTMEIPTKRNIQDIKALQDKKTRMARNEYVIEGIKMVEEALETCPSQIRCILYSDDKFGELTATWGGNAFRLSEKDLQRISGFKQHSAILAVMKKPKIKEVGNKIIVLDDIQDPGNFGTIIRIADWFGITDVIASHNSVDAFNPKTVQASMGSIFRINVQHLSLDEFLSNNKKPIYGAVLDGQPLSDIKMEDAGILLIGNESKGLSSFLKAKVSHPITIERKGAAESLNAAIACGIICQHWT